MNEYGNEGARRGGGARERIYHQIDESSRRSRETLFLAAVAIGVFLFVAALSVRQLTEPGTATRILEDGIAATTEVDVLLGEHAAEMRSAAARPTNAGPLALPGYPIDVYFTGDEAARMSDAQLREALLSRSAAIVYESGLAAFDRTGHQSISRFSAQGAMDLVIGRLSATTHDRANVATVLFGAVVVLGGVLVLLLSEGLGAFRRLGQAVVAGGVGGFVLVGGAWVVAGRLGGDDPFVAELMAVVRMVLEGPLRNYAAVSILGLVLAGLGVAVEVAGRRLAAPAQATAAQAPLSFAQEPDDEITG